MERKVMGMDSGKRATARRRIARHGLELRVFDIDRSRGACGIAVRGRDEASVTFPALDQALGYALRREASLARIAAGEEDDPYFWIVGRLVRAARRADGYDAFLGLCSGDLASAEAEILALGDHEFADVAARVRRPPSRDARQVVAWVQAELGMPVPSMAYA